MKHPVLSSILNTLLFLGGVCQAQSIPLKVLPGDTGFSTSSVWPSPSMQWASRFTYSSPILPAGIYRIVLTFQEIPGGAITGPGQRVFSVGWLGQNSGPIDLWKLAGTEPVQVVATAYLSFPTSVVMSFVATVRNAVVSEIDIQYGSFPGNVFVPSGDSFQGLPCPIGWTGPRLLDGNCLAVIFSQPQGKNISGQSPELLVQLRRAQ